MKKLVLLVLGIVLFSGVAGAKLYWLPDYQYKNMKRVNTDHDDPCPNGTYSTPLDKDKYDCSYDPDVLKNIHRTCYTCKARKCTSGVIEEDCITTDGYTWKENGYYSGKKKCGECEPVKCNGVPESECETKNGYNWEANGCRSAGVDYGECNENECIDMVTKDDCLSRTCGEDGWEWIDKNCLSAGVKYGVCKEKECQIGYSTGITECSKGYGLLTLGCKGASYCRMCKPLDCPNEEVTKATCLERDGGSSVWYWTSSKNMSGKNACGTCKVKSCPDGYVGSPSTPCDTSVNYLDIFSNVKTYTLCAKCMVSPCKSGYSVYTYESTCKEGEEFISYTTTDSNRYSGTLRGTVTDLVCGKCETTCYVCPTSTGCSEGVLNAGYCGQTGFNGWKADEYTCTIGTSFYYKCSPLECKDYGYGDKGTTEERSCGYEEEWRLDPEYYGFSGDAPCGGCQCPEGSVTQDECSGTWIGAACTIRGEVGGKCSTSGGCQRESCSMGFPTSIFGSKSANQTDNCGNKTCYGYTAQEVFKYVTSGYGCSGQADCSNKLNNCYSHCSGMDTVSSGSF